MKTIIYWALAITTVVWSACDKDDDNKNKLQDVDRTFVNNAAYGNRAEIEMGTAATSQSSTDQVKAFGQMMVTDHTPALNELKSIAEDNHANFPTMLDDEHLQKKQMLMSMSGHAFDTAYMHSQVMDHQKTLALFQAEATNGKEQRLKDYANKYLPAIQHHLEEAQNIYNTISQ